MQKIQNVFTLGLFRQCEVVKRKKSVRVMNHLSFFINEYMSVVMPVRIIYQSLYMLFLFRMTVPGFKLVEIMA